MISVCVGDVVWHAGSGSSGLAEEHGVSSLHTQQQTDHLVLAGVNLPKHHVSSVSLLFNTFSSVLGQHNV